MNLSSKHLIGDYNPEDDSFIGQIKEMSCILVDIIDDATKEAVCDEAKPLCDQAKLLILQAQMLAVKAIYIGRED